MRRANERRSSGCLKFNAWSMLEPGLMEAIPYMVSIKESPYMHSRHLGSHSPAPIRPRPPPPRPEKDDRQELDKVRREQRQGMELCKRLEKTLAQMAEKAGQPWAFPKVWHRFASHNL